MTKRWASPRARAGATAPPRGAGDAGADVGSVVRDSGHRARGVPAPDVRRPLDDVSYGIQVAAWWSLCFLLILTALTTLGWLLSKVFLVTVTVTIAIMICALLEPSVSLLRRIGIPRSLAALVVFVLGVAAISWLTWYSISQIADAKDVLVNQVQDAAGTIRDWLVDGPLHVAPGQANKYTTNLGDTLADHQAEIASGVASQASSAVSILSGGVLCLFATLFMLLDNGSMWRWFVRLAPEHSRNHVRTAGVAAWRTLTAYMRSLVLLGGLNALAMVPVMWLAGLPLVAPLAVLLFLGSLVPLIGVIAAGIVVCLIALVTKGVATAIVMAVVLVLIVQLFGNLLNPIILGKAVDLHPLAILVTVTAGTLLAGAFGAFVAVPFVAVINNGIKAIRDSRDPQEV